MSEEFEEELRIDNFGVGHGGIGIKGFKKQFNAQQNEPDRVYM